MTKPSLCLTSLIICLVTVAGCSQNSWTLDLSSQQLTNTVTYASWTPVQAGVDFEQVLVQVGTTNELFDIVRINPSTAHVKIGVDETIPKTVANWQTELGASVVINASYFDENYHLLTQTNTDTHKYGKVLTGKTGLAWEKGDNWMIGPWDGSAAAADLSIQSYPMLVTNHTLAFNAGSVDTAQRTLLAQDDAGNLYFIIAENGVLSLVDLANVLTNQFPLKLANVLNLDGGTSTGLVIHSPAVSYQDNSLVVPAVLYLAP